MDRRQRKTREAIFSALVDLLSKKDFGQITVGEIIARADVGRATFYAHFETKDLLLAELCKDLFCHIFDAASNTPCDHRHIFSCDAPDSVFLHLFRHLQTDDHRILTLLSCQSSDLFLQYFKRDLKKLAASQLALFAPRKSETLPEDFWVEHIAATFVETVRWWVAHGMRETPETITEYFYLAV